MVTGGEPLAQQDALAALVGRLAHLGFRVEVHTTGAVVPEPELVAATHLFVVSPTPPLNGQALNVFVASGRAVFKVVARNRADLDELASWEERLALYPIWVVPEGDTVGQVVTGMRWLAGRARSGLEPVQPAARPAR